MAASLSNPHYTVTIVTADGDKYYITNALTDLTLTENEKELAQKVIVKIPNIKVGKKWMSSLVSVRDRIYVYANTGSKKGEVFRGYIWQKSYVKDVEKELKFICYDNLIYLQESEENYYFSKGKSTKTIFSTICSKKGIKLTYNHVSMNHPKLSLRGTLGDLFTNDLLDEVRKKKGKKAVIRSAKGRMYVITIGSGNSTVYQLYKGAGGSILSAEHTSSMDGMVTKVVILGKENEKTKKAPVKATVTGNTSKYGTLKKIIDAGDSLSDAKKEAKQTIKDDGKPKITRIIKAVDNPWIRKGDKVYMNDGSIKGNVAVLSITHDATDKTMTLEVEAL